MGPPNNLVPHRFHDAVDAGQGHVAPRSLPHPPVDFGYRDRNVNGADLHTENIEPRDPVVCHRGVLLRLIISRINLSIVTPIIYPLSPILSFEQIRQCYELMLYADVWAYRYTRWMPIGTRRPSSQGTETRLIDGLIGFLPSSNWTSNPL